MNDLTGNVYDERIGKLLEDDVIHNDDTSHYKAACYILYVDLNHMKVEDELTIERFVLHLFLISTKLLTWGQGLPSNYCDVNGIWCEDGHIIELDFGKYFMTKT